MENPTLLSSIVDDVLALERHCYAYKVYLRKTFEVLLIAYKSSFVKMLIAGYLAMCEQAPGSRRHLF